MRKALYCFNRYGPHKNSNSFLLALLKNNFLIIHVLCKNRKAHTERKDRAGFSTMSSRIMLQFPAPFLSHTEKQNYWRISIYEENRKAGKKYFCSDAKMKLQALKEKENIS